MNDLLARAIAAHGGLGRWDTFNRVSATIIAGGGLLPMKGLEADTNPLEVTVTLHEESASISPFGQPDWRMAFTPDRVAIETTAGTIVRERSNPRSSFAGHIYEHAVGSASPCLLQRLCEVDLPHDAILDGNAGLRGHRNKA